MYLYRLLQKTGVSYFLVQKGEQAGIVVSAIHHAPAGVSSLPSDRHKASDESIGYLALKIARKLKCSLIVASNYFLDINKPDPNIREKKENTDYLTWLFHNKPQILVEIHGHNGKKSKADIEISSGKPRQTHSIKFAEILRSRMKRSRFKRDYSVSGDYNKIYYKASEAVTVNSSEWLALHVELCPELRKDNSEANKIANCIVHSLKEFLVEGNYG